MQKTREKRERKVERTQDENIESSLGYVNIFDRLKYLVRQLHMNEVNLQFESIYTNSYI